ncbi:MAG TPA: hypothetical protein VFM57_10035 [Thermoleophilaceae bacterium]|nr:hypothetical protein [Thermoleophilaceae bacterium]
MAPATPAAIHWLTPGSPTYMLLKVGAIAGLILLRVEMARRARARQREEPPAHTDG